jgi:hypothetical protein
MNRKGGKKDTNRACVCMYAREREKAPNDRWMDVTLTVANVI